MSQNVSTDKSIRTKQDKQNNRDRVDLLVGDEDLVGRDKMGHRNGLVALPLLESLNVVDENEEVLVVALVVDLGCGSCALDHVGGDVCECECEGVSVSVSVSD